MCQVLTNLHQIYPQKMKFWKVCPALTRPQLRLPNYVVKLKSQLVLTVASLAIFSLISTPISFPLSRLFNNLFEDGHFPEIFKQSHITALYKGSGLNSTKKITEGYIAAVEQMQPVWLCLFLGRQFERTCENAQWRKIKQMQPMWLCLFLGR